jgi:HSP20 family protein
MKLAKYPGNKKQSLARASRASAIERWQREINRLFGDPFGDWLIPEERFMQDWMPAINVYEEKDNLVVEAELPGMKKEDIQIYVSGDNLHITGERGGEREEKARNTYRVERPLGRFHRMIALPAPIKADEIEAHYRDGILTVTCPKKEDARRKQVEVKGD